MADDRPAGDDLAVELAALRSKVADLESTALVRAARRPTGDIEMTLRAVPKPDTVFLHGQILDRSGYPGLWQWITDTSPAGFSTTDTTMTLPDYRGRTVVGAGTGAGVTYALGETGGSASRTLAIANLPAHDHPASTSSDSHTHSGTTGAAGGNHGEHNHTSLGVRRGVDGDQYVLRTATTGWGNDAHAHGFSTSSDSHSHAVDVGSTGGGQAFDNRPPYVALNYQIWT